MMVLERDGKIDEALAAAERTLELEPDAAIPALARVRYLAQLGRLNEAKEGLAPLKQRFSDHVEVLTTEGRIALIERRLEDALGIFERAFDLQPDNTRVVDLTKTGVSLGRSDKYLPVIDSWLEENPEQLGVREKFSEMLIVVGKLPEAKQQYELILERSPNNAQALNNLAWLQVELGEAEAAVATGRRAVHVAPGNPAPLDTLAVALLETGEKKEALELLTAANKAAPQDPDIRFHLARALAANGDTAGAVLTLKSLLESDARFRQRSQAVALLESLSQQ
jgi:tetratricopeptide (TPR) repeat protein